MKTSPLPAPIIHRDDLLISDEVILTNLRTGESQRLLLPVALVVIANCVHVKTPFELRKLNQELLASFDGNELEGRAEVLTPLPILDNYLENFGNSISQQLLARLRAESESANSAQAR